MEMFQSPELGPSKRQFVLFTSNLGKLGDWFWLKGLEKRAKQLSQPIPAGPFALGTLPKKKTGDLTRILFERLAGEVRGPLVPAVQLQSQGLPLPRLANRDPSAKAPGPQKCALVLHEKPLVWYLQANQPSGF